MSDALDARDGVDALDVGSDPDFRGKAGERLRRDGYCVLRGLFPPDVLERISARAQGMLARPSMSGSVGYYMRDCGYKLFDALLLGGPTVDVVTDERVLDVLESHLGGECLLAETVLKQDLGIYDVFFPLHSDFTPDSPGPAGESGPRITKELMAEPFAASTLLYLHDTKEGALCYAAGSHRMGAPHGLFLANYPGEFRKRIAGTIRRIEGKRGDLVLFDDRGFHGSEQPARAVRTIILSDYYKIAAFGNLTKSPPPLFLNDLSGLNARQMKVLGLGAGIMVPYGENHIHLFRTHRYRRPISRLLELAFSYDRFKRRIRNRLKGQRPFR